MSEVLEFFRQREPRFRDVPDAELTDFISQSHPEFLKDPEFAAQAAPKPDPDAAFKDTTSPFFNAPRSGLERAARDAQTGRQFDEQQREAAGASPQEWAALRAQAEAEHELRVEDRIKTPAGLAAYVAARDLTKAVPRAGRLTLAAMSDLTTQGQGSTKQFIRNPDEPLPAELGASEMHGVGSVPTKAAIGLIKATPAIGASLGLGLAGAPAALAAATPMAFDELGNFAPAQAAIAAALPGISKLGEAAVAKGLSKLQWRAVMELNNSTGQVKGRLIQKLGGVDISNDTLRKFMEQGGGAIAANLWLAATSAPEILALPPEQRKGAMLDMLASNLGPSLLAFSSRPGDWSKTFKNIVKDNPTLAQTFVDLGTTLASNFKNAPRKPRFPGQPAEEGGAVPPGDASQIIRTGPNGETLYGPEPTARPATEKPSAPPDTIAPGNKIADMVGSGLLAGHSLKKSDVVAWGNQLGMDERQSGEWAELGATEAARAIAQSDMSNVDKFRALVSLYNRMPVNSSRTVDTRVNQQYSTPPPLAFLAGLLSDIAGGKSIVEPTAGHGMLTIGAAPNSFVHVNELDADRTVRLMRYMKKFFGGNPFVLTSHDAADETQARSRASDPPDRAAMNPPFGNVLDAQGNSKDFPIIKHVTKAATTKSIDIAIALNTFEKLTPDGKGFAIIGAKTGTGHNGMNPDPRARAEAYRRANLIEFFQRFNVVDWFTVSGDLYQNMGAGWPVDVIVVHGKQPTPRPENGGMARPWMKPPRVIESWDELEKLIPHANKITSPSPPVGGGGGKLPGTGGGSAGQPGSDPTPAPRTEPKPPSLGGKPPGGGGGPVPSGKSGGSATGLPGGGTGGGGSGNPKVGEKGTVPPKSGPPEVGAKGAGDTGATPAPRLSPKLDDLFGKLRGKLNKPQEMAEPGNRLDPEALALAGQVAEAYAEQGVTQFAAFAKQVLTDAPDLWPQLKGYLHSAWLAASNAHPELDEVSRKDAAAIIDDLENQAEPAVTTVTTVTTEPPKPIDENLSLLVPYRPVSKNGDPKLMTPRNIGDNILTALLELQREVGMPLDEYVAGKLGLTQPKLFKALNAAQIDATALAIRNIERKSALINSDQTGVGKGRVVAALIKYAQSRNLIPVFVSASKQLYTDMLSRDLVALGDDKFKPFVTDNKHYYVDGKQREHNFTRAGGEGTDLFEAIAQTGALPENAQGIFTTYFQITKDRPAGFKEDGKLRARRKRRLEAAPDGPMMRALRRIAPRALFILDESHLAAGGSSEAGMRLATMIPNAAGVYYSSATFAKRPDNLNVYGVGTLMNRSGLSYAALTDLLDKGGVPLQQALTSMLSDSGEFIRREMDWSGTPIEFKQTSANGVHEVEMADDYTSYLRDLMKLAEQVNATAAGIVDSVNGSRPEDVQVDLSDIRFSSRLFNLSNQYLLALRAEAVVKEAVAELKAGRKPFITVSNTMEKPIQDLQHMKLPLSFNGLLMREMQKMLTITIRDPMEETGQRTVELKPEQLADGGKFYRQLEAQIKAHNFEGMPISPIDYIKKGITEARYTIGELTGRSSQADSSAPGDEVVITKREDVERNKILGGFNHGQLDALIGNGAATTGLSAHTAPEFKDQRPRTMLTAQMMADINAQVQFFGRIFRNGQTSLPKYVVLTTALAAERRFAIMLRGKMSSLNANTSADTESGWTKAKGFSADIFNEIGDDAAWRVMESDPEAASLADISMGDEMPEGFARYATGRFVLLPDADAQRLYDRIIEQYEDTIRILDEAGENPLRAKAEDLRAQTLDSSVLIEGSGKTPFDGPAMLERVNVTPPKSPMTHDEAAKQAAENRAAFREHFPAWSKGSREAEAERLAKATERGATPEQLDRIRATFQNVRDQVAAAFQMFGDTVGVDPTQTGEISFHAVVMDLKLKGGEVSDFASASRQELILATNTYKRKFTIPLSKFAPEMLQAVTEGDEAGVFDGNAETNTERYVITGNLLAGFEAAQGMGQGTGQPRVAIYTTHDGSTRTGILMPPKWTPDAAETGAGQLQPLTTAEELFNAIRGGAAIQSLPGSSIPLTIIDGLISLPSSSEGRQLWGLPTFRQLFQAAPWQRGNQFLGNLVISENTIAALSQMFWQAGVKVGVRPSQSEARGERTHEARGLFVKGFTVGKGNLPPTVTLGGMQHVRPMEMPEIVKLARQMLKGDIKLKKPRGKAVAFFKSGGGQGFIQMDPTLFKNSMEAAQVIAHELGHAYDWFDTKSGAPRGNIWGHIAALHLFLRQKFGRSGVTSRELKAELIKLTEYWRPWDRSTSPPSFNDYRESPEELYADALSVLFNAPNVLEQRAPKFYKAFWEALDQRPAARDALLGIQRLLNKGKLQVLQTREEEIRQAFQTGEQIWRDAVLQRKTAASTWQGWWERMGQELYWNFFPLERRANKLEKAGIKLEMENDPRYFLDNLGFRDVEVMRFGRTIFEKVIQPLEAAGITLEDAGLYLQLTRVALGDRASLGNPGGQNPATAREGLLKQRLDFGMEKMTLLKSGMDRFHAEVFKLAQQAVEVGAYNATTFKTVIEPNKDFYAAVAVLDYLDDYIPAAIREQIGTLKDAANPFHATILKSIATVNLIAYQRAKNGTVDFLQQYYTADIIKAPGDRKPATRKGKGIFMRLENGAPVYYYTDPYIADAFDKGNPRQLFWLTKAMDGVFRKIIYPLIITYNPAFLYIMSPLRDVQRTARNLPGVRFSVGTLPASYLGKLGEAKTRHTGQAGPLIREMEANMALGTPFDQFVRGHRDDFMADLLKRMRVLPDHELRGWYNSNIFKPVRKLLDGLELGGMTLDTVAKVAAYSRLRKMGYSPKRAAFFVRNYAGLPNINKKGLIVRHLRALTPFWNVFTQGWRADFNLATKPATASGWWFRYMASNGFIRALLALAVTGALGAALKELFDGISEYNKTNYASIPLGSVFGGDFASKTVFLRLPEDESARLIGGVISKAIRAMGPDDVRLSGIFDFGMGQIPSLNPALTVPLAWTQFAAGHNPIDAFRGRPVVTDRAWDAGGLPAVQEMGAWTLEQSGALNFVRWDKNANTTAELTLSAIPGINKFIKVTDQGKREQQRALQDDIASMKAREKLKMSDAVQSLEMEYWRLSRIKPDGRTDAQQERFADLKFWYARIYRPYWEDVQSAIEDKQPAAAEAARKALDKDSAEYQRRR